MVDAGQTVICEGQPDSAIADHLARTSLFNHSKDIESFSEVVLMPRRWRKVVVRAWQVGRTKLLWGWRLHALGGRSVLGRALQLNNPCAVAIGTRVVIAPGFILADLCVGRGEIPKIVIGDDCIILHRFQCNAVRSVRIARNVLIASNVLITDSDHVVEPGGVPVTRNRKFVTKPVCISENCWIGQNAVVLKGVTIGHDSIVGANSVVTKSVPPCSVVAGNPARVIRSLVAGPVRTTECRDLAEVRRE